MLDPVRAADPADSTPAHQEASPTPVDPAETDSQDDSHSSSEERAGLDARRRGWFWHWNNVVTQYAPLIGLKGVGLLNSYTVWTDRRDESPHRGYAFPSQQSEADFYGEERAELITINKILVALDLIEIRKEMLTRVDERGRRWRVPHNLYRVKDRPDGVDLRALDVLRVAKLAQQDETVFRYIRRVFSERFRPIDGDNVWHAILSELRNDPTWRELQERTRAIEARASARTRAGHQSRTSASAAKSQPARKAPSTSGADTLLDKPQSDDRLLHDIQQTGTDTLPRTTSVESSNTGSNHTEATDVAPSNDGSPVAVAASNTGSDMFSATIAAAGNDGRQPVVGPGNTTYDQTHLTTTTTTTTDKPENGAASVQPAGKSSIHNASPGDASASELRPIDDPDDDAIVDCVRMRNVSEQAGATSRPRSASLRTAVGQSTKDTRSGLSSGMDEGVEDGRDRRVVSGGTTTGQQLDERIEGGSDERRSAGTPTGSGTGERSLVDPAAGGPLVDPGPLVISTFEAANDRRATPLERHLLAELERDADPAARAAGSTGAEWVVAAMREAVSSGSAFVAPKRIREIIARWSANPRNAPPASSLLTSSSPNVTPSSTTPHDEVADVRLPGGASGNAVWASVLDDLARTLDREAFDRLLAGSRVTRYWRGTVEVRTADRGVADKLSNEYRGLVERHLNSRLRRPVAVRFAADPADAVDSSPLAPADEPAPDAPQPLVIAEAEVEIGRQVWQSLLADLARIVTPADLDRLAGVVVLGQDTAGAILLGTSSPLARRLLEGRYRADVESSLAALLGQPSSVRVLDAAGWSIAPHE